MVMLVLVVVVVVILLMPLVKVLVLFGFRKKGKGLDDLFWLPPIKSHGLLRETCRKLTMANANGGYRCYR